MSKAIGVGIIGTGFGAKVQLPGFLGLPEAKVIGIASKDIARSEELAQQHLLPRSFGSYEALIACDDVQLVSITTPPFAHAELVKMAIDAGKHVLCEKPFTLSAAQAAAALKHAKTAGIIHAVDYEFRELTAVETLREHLPAIGKLKRAELEWAVGTWANPQNTWRWQCDASQGGGVVGALGVHLFDAAEWLFGPMQSVTADVQTRIKERPDGKGSTKPVTSEDYAKLEMLSAASLPVTVTVSNVLKDGKGLTVIIEGEKGRLKLLSASQTYGSGLKVLKELHGAEPQMILEETQAPAAYDARIPPFQDLARRLIKAVQEGDTGFSPSFEEGLRGQLIREAALASHGAKIDIQKAER